MPAPNIRFYAVSIHNFAASTVILEELQHAVERARNGEGISDVVILQTRDALSTMVDAARAMLAATVAAGGVRYDDLAAEVADILVSAGPTHCAKGRDLLTVAVTREVAALETFLLGQKLDSVSDVTEAKNALARIAKGGA